MMKKWICLALCLLMVSGCALAYDGTAPIDEEPITISVLTTMALRSSRTLPT